MKLKIGNVAFIASLFIAITSCKTSSTADESTLTADSTAAAMLSQSPAPITMCMLPEVGIRETPGESGKYLTALYLSEAVSLTGDSAMVTASNGTEYKYHKVELEGGKQGWVRSDFIAQGVVPAVFTAVTSINKRPDIASVSDKNFTTMDLVATRPSKDNWIEVVGIPSGEKWFVMGYVHSGNLTYDPTDVSFAALYKRASSMKDAEKGSAMMTQLTNNTDLQASQFYAGVFGGTGEVGDDPTGEGKQDDNFAIYALQNAKFVETISGTVLDNNGVVATIDRFDNTTKAASFNGSSYLSSPLFADLQDATYTLWVKSDKAQTASILALGNNCFSGYSIGIDNSLLAILCGGVKTNITNSTYSLPVGEWVHLTLVKSSDDFYLYVNGELSSTGSSSHNDLTSLFTIGAGSGCNGTPIGGYFTGSIDDLIIHHRAYEADGVRALYQQSK